MYVGVASSLIAPHRCSIEPLTRRRGCETVGAYPQLRAPPECIDDLDLRWEDSTGTSPTC